MIGNVRNIRQGDFVPTTYWLSLIILPSGTLFLLLTTFTLEGVSPAVIFISILFVLIINFSIFYLYDEMSRIFKEEQKKRLVEQQNKYYEKQLEMMRTSMKAIRTIRHDLRNHMMSLSILVSESRNDDAIEYLSQIIEVQKEKENQYETGNLVVDSILNFKLQTAEKEGIHVYTELRIPEDLNFPSFDMTIVLGNLLDNALQAVRKLEQGRYINLKLKYTKGTLIVKIENPFEGIILRKNGGFRSSKKDKSNHGIGLESVKSVVEKYNGAIEFKYIDNKFHVGVLLFVPPTDSERT